MNNVSANLNIYFKDPYWVGEYSRKTGDNIEICEFFFDSEPPTHDIYNFLLKNFNKLIFQKDNISSKLDTQISSTL